MQTHVKIATKLNRLLHFPSIREFVPRVMHVLRAAHLNQQVVVTGGTPTGSNIDATDEVRFRILYLL